MQETYIVTPRLTLTLRIPETQSAHPLLQTTLRLLLRLTRLELAQRDTTILIVGRHLLPLLNLRHARSLHRLMRILHRLPRHHISYLDERDRYQARTSQATYRLRDEPFWCRLCDYDDRLALLRL